MTLRSTKWLQVLRVAAAPAFVAGLSALAGTAQAQFFGDRYYNNEGGYYGQRYQQPQPRELDNPPSTDIVVIGDSLADWLAYGLDETYSDQPDMGVVRKIRPTSGLIRYDAKNDTLDWPSALKDTLAGERPNAIVIMLGLNDRIPLKDRLPLKPVPPAKPPEAQVPGQAAAAPQTPPQAQGPAPNQAQGQAKSAAQSP